MKETKKKEVRYVLDLNEVELSIMGKALYHCLFEIPDYSCCYKCRTKEVEVFEKTFALFMKTHKHS